jgi:hypothetical protein
LHKAHQTIVSSSITLPTDTKSHPDSSSLLTGDLPDVRERKIANPHHRTASPPAWHGIVRLHILRAADKACRAHNLDLAKHGIEATRSDATLAAIADESIADRHTTVLNDLPFAHAQQQTNLSKSDIPKQHLSTYNKEQADACNIALLEHGIIACSNKPN